MIRRSFPESIILLWLAFLPCVLPAQTARSESGIVYRSRPGLELKLDIAVPEGSRSPCPTLVFLFGGGFLSGDRQNWMYAMSEATRRGYVAVSIDYSLTSRLGTDAKPLFAFPTQVHDVKAAVRWIRKHGTRYGIDPNRLGAVGFSSGGNLALLLGLTGDADFTEAEIAGEPSARVQAVVNLAGCTDLTVHHAVNPSYMESYLGGPPAANPERYRTASPVSWASADDPPVLTVVGDADPVLPQELALDAAFLSAGANHSLIILPGVGHSQGRLWPSEAQEKVWAFLEKHLKPGT